MKYIVMLSALIFGISVSTTFAQDQAATDHSQHHAAAGTDHMAHLDADLDEIRKTDDPAKRKEMLLHHLHMMAEQMKTMAAMDHGAMGGEGMKGMDHGAAGQGMDMMQHHQHMMKMMDHMLAMQELMLGLIDTK